MPYLSTSQCELYYEIEGKGTPLILIAGFNSDLRLWTLVKEELARHFQLILLDNRGIGRSRCSKAPFTLNELAEDVLELIKKLCLQKPHILGHSMGGAIVQILAHRYRDSVNKTIFVQAPIKLSGVARAALTGQLHLYEDQIPEGRIAETILPWVFSESILNNREFCASFLELHVNNPYPPPPKGLRDQLEALCQFDSENWCGQIKTSPLILSSDEDRLISLKETTKMAEKIPGSQLHVFKGVGHVSPIECPKEFCKVVRDFL